MRARVQSTPISGVDRDIAELASRQHGTVGRRQLLAFGLSAKTIDRRVARRWLHVIHPGVYAVGHRALTMRGLWMAAVLAGGPGAVLSHRAAAALWGVRRSSAIEVTSPRHLRRRGIVAHRATLPPDEVTTRAAIPVTTITRTVYDLAAVRPYHDVEAAANQAEYQQLTDTLSLGALVARHPHCRGIASLKRLIADNAIGTRMSRSDLEIAFQAFLDAHRLPRPDATNVHVEAGGRLHECDNVWFGARLIVELDGPGHATRKAFYADRADDRALTVAGWIVIRVTERDLLTDGPRLAADLAVATAARSSPSA
jgi:very-short-patch-repair endonuclease